MSKTGKRLSDGLQVMVRKGKGFLIARGVEQPDEIEFDDNAVIVEVGPRHSVAIPVDPSDVVDIARMILSMSVEFDPRGVIGVACGTLSAAMPHIIECPGCRDRFIDLVEDMSTAFRNAELAEKRKKGKKT
jgi:hypothetical protein